MNLEISADLDGRGLEPIVRAIHTMIGLPTAMRSVNKKGILMESGKVIDYEYTGPALEYALRLKKPVRCTPAGGRYKNVPVSISPLFNNHGELVAVIGIVDVLGTVDLAMVFKDYPDIINQVESAFAKK